MGLHGTAEPGSVLELITRMQLTKKKPFGNHASSLVSFLLYKIFVGNNYSRIIQKYVTL